MFGHIRGKSWNSVALGNHKKLSSLIWEVDFWWYISICQWELILFFFSRRAVAQRCPLPPMINLISVGGQHQGNFDLFASFFLCSNLYDHLIFKNSCCSLCTRSQPSLQNPVFPPYYKLASISEKIGRELEFQNKSLGYHLLLPTLYFQNCTVQYGSH